MTLNESEKGSLFKGRKILISGDYPLSYCVSKRAFIETVSKLIVEGSFKLLKVGVKFQIYKFSERMAFFVTC